MRTAYPPVGTFEFEIDAYLTDFRGKATLPMIGGFMLQAATRHAEQRGFGYSDMLGQQRAWVLSRMVIEMFEYPKNDTVFVLKTWVADVNKLFTERYFSFEDKDGKQLGYAKSIWASIDLETRRPTEISNLEKLINYVDKVTKCPIDGIKKIPLQKNDAAKFIEGFAVKYSDIDINKHLSSLKYIEHFVDVFDIDVFKAKEIRRFQINYISEVHYEDSIRFVKNADEDGNIFTLEMKNGNRTVCSSRITWN